MDKQFCHHDGSFKNHFNAVKPESFNFLIFFFFFQYFHLLFFLFGVLFIHFCVLFFFLFFAFSTRIVAMNFIYFSSKQIPFLTSIYNKLKIYDAYGRFKKYEPFHLWHTIICLSDFSAFSAKKKI